MRIAPFNSLSQKAFAAAVLAKILNILHHPATGLS